MNIHKNARLTPPGRLLLVQRIEGGGWGLMPKPAARIWTALAPSIKAAAAVRPSATPPAAMTGTDTASTICGKSENKPGCMLISMPVNVARCPPASTVAEARMLEQRGATP